MKKMKKCKSCKHYDTEKSNENWVVCPCIPLDVMLKGTSKDCENYEEITA